MILFVSEINRDITKNNLCKRTNEIFYNSFIKDFNKIKFISREIIEHFLNQNKENVIKYINNIITEEKDCECINNIFLDCHYMNLEKLYQITVQNYIFDENKQNPKYHNYPKIVVFPKEISIINLYYEIFKIKKNIIIEKDPNDNNSSKKQIDKNTVINELFKELFVTKDKFDINKIFGDKTPFYLCIQKYNCNNAEKNIDEEICLLLNENEKNKKLVEILNNLEQSNFPNEQIILKIYWNPKYTNNVIKYLRPEKIDSFLNKLINFDEKINSNSIQNLNGLKQIENNTNKEEIIF